MVRIVESPPALIISSQCSQFCADPLSNFTSEERSGGMSDFVLSELFRFNEPILARPFFHQRGVLEFVQE